MSLQQSSYFVYELCMWVVVYSQMSILVWTCINHISLFISVFWQVIFVNEKETSKAFDLGPSYKIINVVWFFTTIHFSKKADSSMDRKFMVIGSALILLIDYYCYQQIFTIIWNRPFRWNYFLPPIWYVVTK